jgi:hypothetical protein
VPKADERASTGAAAPARSVHDLGPGLVGPASLARAPTSRAFGAAAPSGSCWVSEIWSVEAVFVLYLFAGRFKNVPPLHGFPIDLTLLFLAATCGLLLWAIAAGRVRLAPPSLPVLATALFSGLALESFVWSSVESPNVDKLVRFLLVTGTSFFASCLLAKEGSRRERLLRSSCGSASFSSITCTTDGPPAGIR